MDFFKYHGLGNDYLVLEPNRFTAPPSERAIGNICDRNRGVGADGILWGPIYPPAVSAEEGVVAAVRIFNPDGSEAEMSGNGLRIFAWHLWNRGLVQSERFDIGVSGRVVRAAIDGKSEGSVSVELGRVRFDSASVPMTGPVREVLREKLTVGGTEWIINGANIGNPHCVVLCGELDATVAQEVGPLIENHPIFPNRTNVQFMSVLSKHRIAIVIWERGAGYTQASGSSSCAAAAVACRLGLCASPVTVEMPGGTLVVELTDDFHAKLTGTVSAVACGNFAPQFLSVLGMAHA